MIRKVGPRPASEAPVEGLGTEPPFSRKGNTTLNTKVSGVAAASTTLQHTPWCDPERHDDGNTHSLGADPSWQICFSTPRELDFGERATPGADVEAFGGGLGFAHRDIWGVEGDVLAYVNVNGADAMCLTPDQLAPIGHLLLALDAEYRGETVRAAELMALAEAGVVEQTPDAEREALREAARVAWQEQAAKDEAAKRKQAAVAEAEGLVARCEQQLADARQYLAETQNTEVSA